MLKKLSITLLVLCYFCFVGCGTEKEDSDDGDNNNSADIILSHGMVNGRYSFDNYEDYKDFYEEFCDYHQERYIMPVNNDLIEFTYVFNCVADMDDLQTGRYDINYYSREMFFEIKNLSDYFVVENSPDYQVLFEVCNIKNDYDYVCNNLSQISNKVNHEQYEGKSISIFVGDIEVAHSKEYKHIIDFFIQNESFTTVMDKILSAFKDINA